MRTRKVTGNKTAGGRKADEPEVVSPLRSVGATGSESTCDDGGSSITVSSNGEEPAVVGAPGLPNVSPKCDELTVSIKEQPLQPSTESEQNHVADDEVTTKPKEDDTNQKPANYRDELNDEQQQVSDDKATSETAINRDHLEEKQETDVPKEDDTSGVGFWLKRGLQMDVANVLMEIVDEGILTKEQLDERCCIMLKDFDVKEGVFIAREWKTICYAGVKHVASFLMSLMKGYHDRVNEAGYTPEQAMKMPLFFGPDPMKIKEIIDRTGYELEVTVGQRRYGPPPDWEGPPPAFPGKEIYVGHIPNGLFEDALIPLMEEVGGIYALRLMMDKTTGKNKGYAFVTFTEPGLAHKAKEKFDGYEIKPGKKLMVNVSEANTRLFIGNISKTKSKEEILHDLKEIFENLCDAITYSPADTEGGKLKNRGFVFADFSDHKSASEALKLLTSGKLKPWGKIVAAEWAELQAEPDAEIMSKVRKLFVGSLTEKVTEDMLTETFKEYGEVESVKKIKDYAFVDFKEREHALKAIEEMNGKELGGDAITVTLAKPKPGSSSSSTNKNSRNSSDSGPGGPSRRGRRNSMPNYGVGGGGGGMRGSEGGFGWHPMMNMGPYHPMMNMGPYNPSMLMGRRSGPRMMPSMYPDYPPMMPSHFPRNTRGGFGGSFYGGFEDRGHQGGGSFKYGMGKRGRGNGGGGGYRNGGGDWSGPSQKRKSAGGNMRGGRGGDSNSNYQQPEYQGGTNFSAPKRMKPQNDYDDNYYYSGSSQQNWTEDEIPGF